MFTREELRAVPLFADLGDKELNYLIAMSADIYLRPGEYAIHKGEAQRALFVKVPWVATAFEFAAGIAAVSRSCAED